MGDYLIPGAVQKGETRYPMETQYGSQGYYQIFDDLPLGVLTAQPKLGRWFCLRKAPEVVLNPFQPIPDIPTDHKQGIVFPPGCEFVALTDAPFYQGIIRLRCSRGVDSPAKELPKKPEEEGGPKPKPKEKGERQEGQGRELSAAYVRFTVENQLNQVLASVRYGMSGFVEVANDGNQYSSTGVRWTQNGNNFFSITVDLQSRTWRVYFKNAALDEVLTSAMPIGAAVPAAISHLRVLNGNIGPSYSLDMGTGIADPSDHFGLLFDRALRPEGAGLTGPAQ